MVEIPPGLSCTGLDITDKVGGVPAAIANTVLLMGDMCSFGNPLATWPETGSSVCWSPIPFVPTLLLSVSGGRPWVPALLRASSRHGTPFLLASLGAAAGLCSCKADSLNF